MSMRLTVNLSFNVAKRPVGSIIRGISMILIHRLRSPLYAWYGEPLEIDHG